jgi:hypothetical protein
VKFVADDNCQQQKSKQTFYFVSSLTQQWKSGKKSVNNKNQILIHQLPKKSFCFILIEWRERHCEVER